MRSFAKDDNEWKFDRHYHWDEQCPFDEALNRSLLFETYRSGEVVQLADKEKANDDELSNWDFGHVCWEGFQEKHGQQHLEDLQP